jgi:hypothetical protein
MGGGGGGSGREGAARVSLRDTRELNLTLSIFEYSLFTNSAIPIILWYNILFL